MTPGVGVQLSPFQSPLFTILTHPITIQNIVMTLGDGSDFCSSVNDSLCLKMCFKGVYCEG